MKSLICLVLDRSGSMGGRENDVVNGVNAFIEEQKKLPDPASIALVRFDSEATERFRLMQPLADMKPLAHEEYQPRGGTPLLDAVGKTMADLDEDWKREQPDRAIMVIVTDGEENASREFTKDKIKAMIESRQESGKWVFIYLGANVDAFHEAASMGVHLANTANYANTEAGVKSMYAAASASVISMRATGQVLADNLGGDIGEDGKLKRKSTLPLSSKIQGTTAVSQSAWIPPAGAAKEGIKKGELPWSPPAA